MGVVRSRMFFRHGRGGGHPRQASTAHLFEIQNSDAAGIRDRLIDFQQRRRRHSRQSYPRAFATGLLAPCRGIADIRSALLLILVTRHGEFDVGVPAHAAVLVDARIGGCRREAKQQNRYDHNGPHAALLRCLQR